MSQHAATKPSGPPEPAEVVARLYEVYADRLTRYCRGKLRSAQEAEDAVQTTFVHAVQALRHGVVPNCEAAWLYTIAKNVCYSMRRADGIRHLYAVDVELDALSAPESASSDLAEGLSEALARLPERQRTALVLREWHGLSSREVASRLGMRTSETYALLTRARRSMAAALRATTGRTAVVIDLGSLLAKLRALLVGGASKATATVTVAVAVAAVGGAVVERTHRDPAPGRASPDIVASTPRSATQSTTQTTRTSTGHGPRRLPARATPTRRRGPTMTSSTDSSAPRAREDAANTAEAPRAVSDPTPESAMPPATAKTEPGPTVGVSTSSREVRVAGRRVRLPRVAPSVAEKVVPPVDVTVEPPVAPDVADVVDAVDDLLAPLSSAPAPPPPPPPALPPVLP